MLEKATSNSARVVVISINWQMLGDDTMLSNLPIC